MALPDSASLPDRGDRRVWLLRHAETPDNVSNVFVGRNDPSLTDAGRKAASELAGPVAALHVDLVVSSTKRRAQETAHAFGVGAPVLDEGFREVDFGLWDGLTMPEAERVDPQRYRAYERGEVHGFPGGETVVAAARRAIEAIDRHHAPRLLVVTHSTMIRIIVAALLGLPLERYRAQLGRPPHLSLTQLTRHEDCWMLQSYGLPATSS